MSGQEVGAGRADEVETFDAVVVTAMADEAAPFWERADRVGRPVSVPGSVQQRIEVAGRRVLLVQSGIGQVNAATAATVALAAVRTPLLVSAGSAGGLGPRVRVGDVVVGTSYVYAGADARAFGYALGQVPGMPPTYSGAAGALDVLTPAVWCHVRDLRVHRGQMLSGDSFVDAAMVAPLLAAFPGALSTDMESTSLAQTAHLFGVPFLSVRGISDLCGPGAGDDFRTHVDDAAERSARVVLGLLAELAPSRVAEYV